MRDFAQIIIDPTGEAMLRNLSISPKKWSNLIVELSELCNASNAKEALGRLFDQSSNLISVSSSSTKAKDIFSEQDTKRILKYIERMQSLQPPSKNKSVDLSVLNIATLEIEKEGYSDLLNAIQKLTIFNQSSIGQQSQFKDTAQSRDFAEDLLSFVETACEANSLPVYLILFKLLLCLWANATSIDFTAVGYDRLSAAVQRLDMHSILDTADLKKISINEEENEHIQTFQCTPRLLLVNGDPSKLSTYEVQGAAVGIITSMSIRPRHPPKYFEITLKGRDFSHLRVGWALCGVDLTGGVRVCGVHLGGADNAWVFDANSGGFFHNANQHSRARRSQKVTLLGGVGVDEDEESREDETLFAGLFNEDSTTATTAGGPGDSSRGTPPIQPRTARVSGESVQSTGSDETNALMNQLFLTDSAEATQSAQTFLDLMRSEDRSDVSSIRRLLMARGVASQLDRSLGSEGGEQTVEGVASERADSRTSNVATAAPSETSEHSRSSSVKELSLPRPERELQSRAAWKAGAQALLPWYGAQSATSSEKIDKSRDIQQGTGSSERSASRDSAEEIDTVCQLQSPSYQLSAGSVIGCLLIPSTGEMRFFVDGVCVGTAPDRLTASPQYEDHGVCPVVKCSATAGVEVNIGQTEYRYGTEILAHLSSSSSSSSDIMTSASPQSYSDVVKKIASSSSAAAALETSSETSVALIADKREGFLSLRPRLEDSVGGESTGSGILVERFQTDANKTFTLEASFRLSEDALSNTDVSSECVSSGTEASPARFSAPGTPSLAGSPFAKASGGDLSGGTSGRSGPARYCLICCGPKTDSSPENQSSSSDDFGCSFGLDARGSLYFEILGGETIRTLPGICKAGQWYHGAVTFTYHRSNSKAVVAFFLNGMQILQQDLMSSKRSRVGRILPRTLSIGGTYHSRKGFGSRSAVSAQEGWWGDLCEMRVWSTARSPERILATLGRGRVSGVEVDLLALFPLEEGCGSVVHDAVIVRNTVKPSDSAQLQGDYHWGEVAARGAADQSLNYLSMSCRDVKNLSARAEAALSIVRSLQHVEVVESESEGDVHSAQMSASRDLICALVSKLFTSCDKFSATFSNLLDASPLKRLTSSLHQLQSIRDNTDVTLLTIRSLFQQLLPMLHSTPAHSGDAIALLVAMAQSLLAVLRINLLPGAEEQAGSTAVRSAWEAPPIDGNTTSVAREATLSALLVQLLFLVSGCGEAGNVGAHIETLRADAVATLLAGLDVFIPGRCNQFFALECLALKGTGDMKALQTSALYHAAATIMTAQGGVPLSWSPSALPADPLVALLGMSPEGDAALFTALCEVAGNVGFAANLVPEQTRPVVAHASDANALWTIKAGQVAVASADVAPKAGDFVQRGPAWVYGSQDGGIGTLGVVLEVGCWRPDHANWGTKVLVQWKHGGVNSYRYGVESATGAEGRVYDVAVLRSGTASTPQSTAPPTPLPKSGGLFFSEDTSIPPVAASAELKSVYPRQDLSYTPEEVRRALIDEKGNGAISKRAVLVHIKDVAPNDWQELKRIMKPVNALMSKLDPSDVIQIYEEFYNDFSSTATAAAGGGSAVRSGTSRIPRIEPRCTQKSAGAESDLASRVTRLLSLLLPRVSTVPQTGELVSGPYQLVLSLHALLTGAIGSGRSSNSSTTALSIARVGDRVVRGVFPGRAGELLAWDWRHGQWSASSAAAASAIDTSEATLTRASAHEKATRVLGSSTESSAKILSDLSIDRNYLGGNLMIKSRIRSVEIVQSGDREWNTCICTTAMHPFTGVYKWYVRVKNFSERRGHCMIGIATSDFSHDEFLGQHQESWGLSPNLDLFHGGRKRRTEAERKLSVGSTVEVTLDTDKGTIVFTELNIDGSPAVIEPLGFDNVRGVVVYPAFSLYSPGDCMSIFTNADDISALRMRDAAFRTPSKTDFRGVSTSKPSRPALLGAPQVAVVEYALQLLGYASTVLRGSGGADLVKLASNPLITVNLPHLLSSLLNWQHVAVSRSKELVDALIVLLESLRGAVNALRSHITETAELTNSKKLADEMLVQLTTCTAAYLGAIAAAWVHGDKMEVNNEVLALETLNATPAATTASVILSEDITHIAAKTTGGSPPSSTPNWLSSTLFAQGFRSPSAETTEPFLLAAKFGDTAFDEFIAWHEAHDRTHKNFRRFGGEALDPAVKLLFAVSLYHGGYLRASTYLSGMFAEYWQSAKGSTAESMSEAHLAVKPPAFSLHCWEAAMKIRSWAREVAGTGLSYDFIAQRIVQRCLFLLDLEPVTADQPFDRSERVLSAWLQSFPTVQDKALTDVSDQVRRFVCDSCPLLELRAAAITNTRKAELRRDGFRAIRAALSHMSGEIGCAAKSALISAMAQALDGTDLAQSVLLSSITRCAPSGEDGSRMGHYTDGLDGVSQSLRLEIQGAFDSYFACLCEELSACSYAEDCAYQLCLLDCLGVRLFEADHTMLSRVNFFFSLQEILDTSLALISGSAVTSAPSKEEDDVAHPNRVVVKATMKLFILMALQVATSRDEERDCNTTSVHGTGSTGDLQAPALRKVKSGPATLSKSVFDILYSQLSEVSREILALSASSPNETHFVPTLFISQSALMITSEATTLLLCVSRNSVCQKILLRPKWLTLLLQMAVLSTPICQQRAILLLSDLLAAVDPNEIQLEDFDITQLPVQFHACWDCARSNLPACIVRVFLALIGSAMVQVGSSPLVNSPGSDFMKEITEAALPVVSEAVGLVRNLYLVPAWTSVVDGVLVSTLEKANQHANATQQEILAALCVLGGQIDAPYRNCPIVFQNPSSSSPRDLSVGVFYDFHDTADKIQVSCYKYDDSAASTVRKAGGLNSPVSRSVIVVPMDKAHAVNRCPIEKLLFSEALVGAVVNFFEKVVLSPQPTLSAPDQGDQPGESKEESSVRESKEAELTPHNKTTAVSASKANEFSLVSDLQQLIATTASRVVSIMAQTATAADRLLHVVSSSPRCKEIVTQLLDEAQKPNKSGGLADLPIFEEYVMIALRQRQKIWATKQEAAHAEVRQSLESRMATPKSPLRGSAADANDSASGLSEQGPLLSLPSPPAPGLTFSTGIPLDSTSMSETGTNRSIVAEGRSSGRSMSPYPPRAPTRPVPGGSVRRSVGGRIAGRGIGASQWITANDARDESYDFAEYQSNEGNEYLVESLTSMGFPARWCELALDMCGGDPEAALNYILSNSAQLEEMVATMDEEEEEAQTILRELTAAGTGGEGSSAEAGQDQEESQPEASPSVVEVAQNASSEQPSAPQTVANQDEPPTPPVALQSQPDTSELAQTVNSSASDQTAVRMAHLDCNFPQLLAFYAEPSLESERLGCIYPGDDFTVVEKRVDAADSANTWYKLSYADFDDGNYNSAYGDAIYDIFVWAPKYFHGQQVIFEGPNESDTENELQPPHGELLSIDKTYTIIGGNGALVREGLEIESAEVRSIKTGDSVHAYEETFNSDGTLRLHIDRPVRGWISKLFGLVQRIPNPAPLTVSTGASVEAQRAGNTSTEKPSELELLDRLDDNMEFYTAIDSFGREDRFFGTQQGGQYNRSRDREKINTQSVYNRRMRVSGMNSMAGYSQGLLKQGLSQVDGTVNALLQTLQNLYCRRILLSLILRENKRSRDQPAETTVATVECGGVISQLIQPAVAERLYMFMRLVVFRGDPFSVTGLESLGFSELFAASLDVGAVTIEQVLDSALARMIVSPPSVLALTAAEEAQCEAFRSTFTHLIMESVARNMRLAASGKFSDHVWADSTYEEDLDRDILDEPNLHYAGWVTNILLLAGDEEVTVKLFQSWAAGLKATSMSMKQIVFNSLASILSHLRGKVEREESAHCSLVLQACLSMLPIQRLLTMCTKKLWSEMEDAPAFSRFLQSFVHFLSEVDLGMRLIDQAALDVSGEVSPVPTGPVLSPRPAEADTLKSTAGRRLCFLQERPVINLKTTSSFVQLSPQKEIAGPWTVELWLRRNEAPEGSSTDNTPTADAAEEPEEEETPFGRRDGPRSLDSLTEKLQGVLRSELMNSSGGSNKERIGLSGLLNLLLGSSSKPSRDSSRGAKASSKPAATKADPAGRRELPGMTLLSSTKGAIKLQSGGRVFGRTTKITETGPVTEGVDIDDPLQESEPVHEEAYCLSFAPNGGTEKKFDVVVPTGRWLHLSIVCQVAPLSLVTIYIDGEAVDSMSVAMNLPLSVLGSLHPETSFVGEVAEMRVWSQARSRQEIVRDMDRDVSGAKCLVSYLRCNEGRGRLTHDKAGIFNSCKLHNSVWSVVPAPALRPSSVPAFMFSESEEAEGLFGSDVGSGARVVEMTGVLKVQGVVGAQGELASDLSEVVCLSYRLTPPSGPTAAAPETNTPIEGYLNWCERDVRTHITGWITPSSTVQFTIFSDSVILGPPESLDWLRGVRFEGSLENGQIKGGFTLTTLIDTPASVSAGSSRIDQLNLPAEIRYFPSVRAAFKAHLLVKEAAEEGQYIATVEVAPYPKFESSAGRAVTAETDSPPVVATASASVIVSPRGAVSSMSPEVGSANSDSEFESYGICAQQGCLWLEWLVNNNCGNIAFGACTADGLSHPDASVDANDDTWTYSVSGQASHGANLFLSDTAEEGDVIGMQIDMDRGHIGFYKNCEFMVGFDDVNAHAKVHADYQFPPPSEPSDEAFHPGIRPFVSLVAPGDSVSYMGLKTGPVEILYPESDPQGRCRLTTQLVDGSVHGYSLLSLHTNTEKWFGNWVRGVEEGLHIRIDAMETSFTGRHYEGGEVVREVSQIHPSENAEAAMVLAKYTDFCEKRIAPTTATTAGADGASAGAASTTNAPNTAASGDAAEGSATAEASGNSLAAQLAQLQATAKITIMLHDAGGENSYFKIMRSVVAKKLFAAYAAKRDCPVRSFVFKFNSVVIDGERTIESYDIDNNATIEVAVHSINAATADEAALEAYLSESTAPYVVQILYEAGALVRSGVEIETSALRTLPHGEIIECFKRSQSSEGVGRFRVADGWISEKLRGGNEAPVVRILAERLPRPARYRVVRDEGARIRSSPSLTSTDIGFCPLDTVLTVSQIRYVRDGREESERTARVRIEAPANWHGGWASVKDHILEKLPDVVGADGATLSEADVAIQTEKDRRARVRAQRKVKLEMMKSKEQALKRRRRVVHTTGTLDVSQETFFLLKRRKSGDGIKVSSDFTTVTCENSSCGRSMVLGSRGFSRGVHYWEVQVNAANWGSVFIGVAPSESSSWNGYGLLNYRATQAFGSETLYGSYFSVNDKVGVLLDMDHGTISFFKDGEDFNVGKVTVVNMGVAYHNLRRIGNRSSSSSLLYPCLGVKSSGDSLTIRRNHWVSSKGLAPSALLQRILHAKGVIHSWNLAYSPCSGKLEEGLVQQMFRGYTAWSDRETITIMSRPGISVTVSTSDAAVQRAAGAFASTYALKTGKIIRTAYGEGRILGAKANQLWYYYEGAEHSAWYWRTDELEDLLGIGTIQFDIEPSAAALAAASYLRIGDASSTSGCSPPSVLSQDTFCAGLREIVWTRTEDEAICRAVNALANKYDIDPLRISAANIEQHIASAGLLPDKTPSQIQARYTALCVVNKAAAIALPLVDFNPGDTRLPMVRTALKPFDICSLSPTTQPDSSKDAIRLIKNVIFTHTKLSVWNYAIKETTTATTAPADEYERPDDLREININRVEARNAEKNKDTLTFQERLRVSVFGQVMASMNGWDERALRRAFAHMQDAGQVRAFFVKFTGEGVDDQGGPYRAVFQTAVGEEVVSLLDMLVPCPNAVTEMGENRDKYLFSPAVSTSSTLTNAFVHLGRLIGMACRHKILVALSLPKVIWKPLAGEAVAAEDLQAVDATEANSLRAIASGDMPPEQVHDLLVQALTSALSARGLHSSSTVQAIATHALSPSTESNASPPAAASSTEALRRAVELVQQLRLTSQSDGLKLLYRGLSAVVPTELLAMFTAEELEAIFCGEAEVDIAVLQKATLYESVSPTDSHIQYFWEAVQLLSKEERAQLINFCSGRSRLPAAASDFHMSFKLTGPPPRSEKDPDDYLPIARTCFFSLSLPKYTSLQVCLEKLRYAIRHTELMDADFIDRRATSGWENVR